MTKKISVDEAMRFLNEFLAHNDIELESNKQPTINYSKLKVAKVAKIAKVAKVTPVKQMVLLEDFTVKGDRMILNNVSILSKKAYSAEKVKGTTMLTIVVIVSQAQKDAITAFHKSN